MNAQSLNRLFSRQLAHLPEEIREREMVLRDLLGAMWPNHPLKPRVETMLRHLQLSRQDQIPLADALLDDSAEESLFPKGGRK